jgi:hypothetical protein
VGLQNLYPSAREATTGRARSECVILPAVTIKPFSRAPAGLVLVVALSLTAGGCLGGDDDGDEAGKRGGTEAKAPPGKPTRFELAAARGQPVTANVPDKPIASTRSSIPGVVLEVFTVQRQGDGSAVLVFGLRNTRSRSLGESETEDMLGPLSAMYAKTGLTTGYTVSRVSLVAGTMQYLPYMENPEDDSTCLCSAIPVNTVSDANLGPGQAIQFAAVMAAPPREVGKVAVVTQLGSVPNVPLS